MKRFVAKRKVKVPRYKILYIIIIFSIVLIFVVNSFLKFSLKRINNKEFLNVLVGNSYGNIFDNYNFYNNKYNIFYKNIYGFDFYKSNFVMEEHNNLTEIIVDSLPLIYIYNTFQTDKYLNNYYSSYSINPVVTQASLILQEYLKKYNVNSIVEKNSVAKMLKDNNIDYSLSYRGSRILLEQAKKENNSLEYFFDLGISDDKKDLTTTSIDNFKYARILFIVGTDNSNYQYNQKLAINLNKLLEGFNKNLTRGISLRGGVGYHGVYNQDFSGNSLLIYVGGKENTIDEVNRSLKILAQVISDYLKGR